MAHVWRMMVASSSLVAVRARTWHHTNNNACKNCHPVALLSWERHMESDTLLILWPDLGKSSVSNFSRKTRSLFRLLEWLWTNHPARLNVLAQVVLKIWTFLCAHVGNIKTEKLCPEHVARGFRTFSVYYPFTCVASRCYVIISWPKGHATHLK